MDEETFNQDNNRLGSLVLDQTLHAASKARPHDSAPETQYTTVRSYLDGFFTEGASNIFQHFADGQIDKPDSDAADAMRIRAIETRRQPGEVVCRVRKTRFFHHLHRTTEIHNFERTIQRAPEQGTHERRAQGRTSRRVRRVHSATGR